MSASWFLFILLMLSGKDSGTVFVFWIVSLFITFH
jgi:hypothetical protein